MITGVQDVFYMVEDMKRAVAFYTDLLGAKPMYESEHWTQWNVGGTTFAVHWTEGRPHPGKGGAMVTFRVADIRAAAADFAKRGVKLGEIDDNPWGSQCRAEDPEGNVFTLMQPPVR
jgi:catechol 2,3-dioxygenase-like lactoylglutathione lyase family enzyme